MTRLDMLRMIESTDPDGGERQPTAADYAAHKQWAIRTFGLDIWRTYARGGWGDHDFV